MPPPEPGSEPPAAERVVDRLHERRADEQVLREDRDRLAAELQATRVALQEAREHAAASRRELTERVAAQARVLASLGELRAQVHALHVQQRTREGHETALAQLAGEVATAARAAREDVERHGAARADAEARCAELERELAGVRAGAAAAESGLRAELDGLRAARDHAVGAELEAEAAREAEARALRMARERLRTPSTPAPAPAPETFAADLARAAERLRLQAEAPEDAQRPASELERSEADPPSLSLVPPAAPASPAVAPRPVPQLESAPARPQGLGPFARPPAPSPPVAPPAPPEAASIQPPPASRRVVPQVPPAPEAAAPARPQPSVAPRVTASPIVPGAPAAPPAAAPAAAAVRPRTPSLGRRVQRALRRWDPRRR